MTEQEQADLVEAVLNGERCINCKRVRPLEMLEPTVNKYPFYGDSATFICSDYEPCHSLGAVYREKLRWSTSALLDR